MCVRFAYVSMVGSNIHDSKSIKGDSAPGPHEIRPLAQMQGSQFLKSLEKYAPFKPFLEKSGKVWKSLEFRTEEVLFVWKSLGFDLSLIYNDLVAYCCILLLFCSKQSHCYGQSA